MRSTSFPFAPLVLVSLSMLAAAAVGCGGAVATAPAASSADAGGPPLADASPTTYGVCPPSLPAFGATCDAENEGLACSYGYAPVECGGRTMECRAGGWRELVHTDPQPDCYAHQGGDAGPWEPPAPIGEECTYTREAGVVTVLAIEVPPPHEYSCANDPRSVVVRIETPSGASVDSVLTIGSGQNPPLSCLAAEGLVVGATMPGTLARIATGRCSAPTLVEFARSFPSCVRDCE